MFRCGLWASSGPFPLSAHYGLYKRGWDPPTNPSRHLKKERSDLPLKWLLKEDQGRRPTAAPPPHAAAETAASPCLDRVLPACSSLAAAAGTLCRLPSSSTDHPSSSSSIFILIHPDLPPVPFTLLPRPTPPPPPLNPTISQTVFPLPCIPIFCPTFPKTPLLPPVLASDNLMQFPQFPI